MFKIIIVSAFVGQAVNLLTNSTKMTHTIYRAGQQLAIDPSDVEEMDKILKRASIKYRAQR